MCYSDLWKALIYLFFVSLGWWKSHLLFGQHIQHWHDECIGYISLNRMLTHILLRVYLLKPCSSYGHWACDACSRMRQKQVFEWEYGHGVQTGQAGKGSSFSTVYYCLLGAKCRCANLVNLASGFVLAQLYSDIYCVILLPWGKNSTIYFSFMINF